MALTDKLKAIANAIRGKTGNTSSVTLDEMVTEINNLPVLSNMNGIVVDEYWTADDEDLPRSRAVGLPKSIHFIGEKYASNLPKALCSYHTISACDISCDSMFSYVMNVVIPPTIIEVPALFFYNQQWGVNINFTENIISIGIGAYAYCWRYDKIPEINYPNSLKTIGNYAFYDTCLPDTITLPEQLETIGSYAFGAYKQTGTVPDKFLYHVNFPQTSLKTIGSCAFYARMNLREAIIPDSVTYLGESAFYYCTSLRTIKLGTGLTTIPKNCFYNIGEYGSGDITIEIPDTITSFGSRAFQSAYFSSFIVPQQVASIGYYCFYGCSKLTTFECRHAVPMTVSGYGVVVYCTALTSVILGSYGNPYTEALLTSVSFKSCTNSSLVITIYTEGAVQLSAAPFGATNATIIYKDSTVEEEAA